MICFLGNFAHGRRVTSARRTNNKNTDRNAAVKVTSRSQSRPFLAQGSRSMADRIGKFDQVALHKFRSCQSEFLAGGWACQQINCERQWIQLIDASRTLPSSNCTTNSDQLIPNETGQQSMPIDWDSLYMFICWGICIWDHVYTLYINIYPQSVELYLSGKWIGNGKWKMELRKSHKMPGSL